MMRHLIRTTLLSLLLFATGAGAGTGTVKNVILFIGDGMGTEQIRASGLFHNGKAGTMGFESLPIKRMMTTHSLGGGITDSAASATAMATGRKVYNGSVGMHDGQPLRNLVEICRDAGKSTGLITTVSVSNATPAGFGAHVENRRDTMEIIRNLLNDTRPNILMGAALSIEPEWAEYAGYRVVTDKASLGNVSWKTGNEYLSGQFRFGYSLAYEYQNVDDEPRLSDMTRRSLELLSTNPMGFFLLVEGAKIDWAGHNGSLKGVVSEVLGLDRAVSEAIDWARERRDTLIIVTADHETGDLEVGESRGKGELPEHIWMAPEESPGSLAHSLQEVPVYMLGGGDDLPAVIDNTDIFHIITKALGIGSP